MPHTIKASRVLAEMLFFNTSPVLSVFPSPNRRPTTGVNPESGAEDNGEIEHVVYETGCSQFCRAMMPYHEGISKSQYDNAYLSDNDREP